VLRLQGGRHRAHYEADQIREGEGAHRVGAAELHRLELHHRRGVEEAQRQELLGLLDTPGELFSAVGRGLDGPPER